MTQKLIFSGVQPTGNLHLGNYLGAIKQWVKIQNEYKSIFCIVDLHAITVPQDPKELKKNILELTAAYIACGIDPEKAIIFQQSDVKEHAELAWILGCNTPLGWLNRMTQFKEKSRTIEAKESISQISNLRKVIEKSIHENIKLWEEKKEYRIPSGALNALEQIKTITLSALEGLERGNSSFLGLYGYPVLMAADILLYNTNLVPVGDDQKQHIELTRDIAISFNQKYSNDVFTIPEPMIMSQAKRVMSLRDGTKKMSKSDESDYSRINLADDAETIAQKFKKAKSDALEGITYDVEKRPEASNLLTIYAALADISIEQAQAKFASAQFSGFKTELADMAVEKLSPITKKFHELKNDRTELQKILDKGASNARKIAEQTVNKVKEVVGF